MSDRHLCRICLGAGEEHELILIEHTEGLTRHEGICSHCGHGHYLTAEPTDGHHYFPYTYPPASVEGLPPRPPLT